MVKSKQLVADFFVLMTESLSSAPPPKMSFHCTLRHSCKWIYKVVIIPEYFKYCSVS